MASNSKTFNKPSVVISSNQSEIFLSEMQYGYTRREKHYLRTRGIQYFFVPDSFLRTDVPPLGSGGLSRDCVLRIPSVIVKGD